MKRLIIIIATFSTSLAFTDSFGQTYNLSREFNLNGETYSLDVNGRPVSVSLSPKTKEFERKLELQQLQGLRNDNIIQIYSYPIQNINITPVINIPQQIEVEVKYDYEHYRRMEMDNVINILNSYLDNE